ncbi:MAG: hypothetical protein RLZZ292_2046 [Bacteroidota bacterium]|jgi:surface antigen
MRKIIIAIAIIVGIYGGFRLMKHYHFTPIVNPNPAFSIAQALDSFNNVAVYYNGSVDNVVERNTAPDGYNLGLKYQCVEFVKRYYYDYYHHKMPDSYGNAIDFYDKKTADGSLNKARNLLQFSNPSHTQPQVGDLIVLSGSTFNPYGHVCIVSAVEANRLQVIQQNPGPFAPPRVYFDLKETPDNGFLIKNDKILGWLRK